MVIFKFGSDRKRPETVSTARLLELASDMNLL